MTMTKTILSRIHAIAERAVPSDDSGENPNLYSKLASIARKLAGTDGAAEKAHAITGIVKDLPDADQARLVAAIEGLAAVKP